MGVKGFLLAGGASKRFGSNKALYRIDGEPMVCRTARALEGAGLETVLVVRSHELDGLGIPLLMEPDHGLPPHPLLGVLAVLESLAEGDSAVIVPCDIPELEPSSVQLLVEEGAPCVAVDPSGRLHPLLVHLSPAWAGRVRDVLKRSGSAMEAMRDAPSVCLPGEQLRNWNVPPG